MKRNINYLAVVEISRIFKGAVTSVCLNGSCSELKKQKEHYNLKNLNVIEFDLPEELVKRALNNSLVITDDEDLMLELLKS